ncbi:MAG: RluA family pseudouridine synthase [Endomicrobiales bacterium]|nr:RluA family pseudouridine synthase [Endomicrobiales bacterium]
MKPVKLTADIAGERIDIHLTKKFGDYSRGYFQRLIKNGDIKVNNKTVVPHYLVKEGDAIYVNFISDSKDILAEDIPLNIIYEDKDILLLNKMSNFVVHPACGHKSGTILNALMGYSKNKFMPLLVHRLDKDTSGVLLVAKNERAKNSLVKQFQNRSIKKTYLVIVKGMLEEKNGRIEAPLGRSPNDRKKMVVGPLSKKMAITEFKVIKRNRNYSLLEVYPITGRTHQIRSHLSYINHPVVGDKFYGGPGELENNTCKRQMLHAHSISFTHPGSGKHVRFKAEPPKDFKKFWDYTA